MRIDNSIIQDDVAGTIRDFITTGNDRVPETLVLHTKVEYGLIIGYNFNARAQ